MNVDCIFIVAGSCIHRCARELLILMDGFGHRTSYSVSRRTSYSDDSYESEKKRQDLKVSLVKEMLKVIVLFPCHSYAVICVGLPQKIANYIQVCSPTKSRC